MATHAGEKDGNRTSHECSAVCVRRIGLERDGNLSIEWQRIERLRRNEHRRYVLGRQFQRLGRYWLGQFLRGLDQLGAIRWLD